MNNQCQRRHQRTTISPSTMSGALPCHIMPPVHSDLEVIEAAERSSRNLQPPNRTTHLKHKHTERWAKMGTELFWWYHFHNGTKIVEQKQLNRWTLSKLWWNWDLNLQRVQHATKRRLDNNSSDVMRQRLKKNKTVVQNCVQFNRTK